jgi:hypothetical protein
MWKYSCVHLETTLLIYKVDRTCYDFAMVTAITKEQREIAYLKKLMFAYIVYIFLLLCKMNVHHCVHKKLAL